MNDASGERHELLECVLTGELPEDAPEVLALIARDPSVRDELDRLLELRGRLAEAARFEDEVLEAAGVVAGAPGENRLAAAARFENEVLGEASALEGAPGEDRVAAFVEARMDELESRSRGSRRRLLAGALAVAASVLILFLWRSPRQDVPLGDILVERVWPTADDEVSRNDPRFEWTLEHVPGWEYAVAVWGDGMETVTSRRSSRMWWKPEGTHAWPDHFEWQVLVYDGSGSEPKFGPVWSASFSE